MRVAHRLQERLEVAVGPLPERAGAAEAALRVEGLPQIDHEGLPLPVGEATAQLDAPADADGQTQHAAPARCTSGVEGVGRPIHVLGADPHLRADPAKLLEGQAALGRKAPPFLLLRPGGLVEDPPYLVFAVSAAAVSTAVVVSPVVRHLSILPRLLRASATPAWLTPAALEFFTARPSLARRSLPSGARTP